MSYRSLAFAVAAFSSLHVASAGAQSVYVAPGGVYVIGSGPVYVIPAATNGAVPCVAPTNGYGCGPPAVVAPPPAVVAPTTVYSPNGAYYGEPYYVEPGRAYYGAPNAAYYGASSRVNYGVPILAYPAERVPRPLGVVPYGRAVVAHRVRHTAAAGAGGLKGEMAVLRPRSRPPAYSGHIVMRANFPQSRP